MESVLTQTPELAAGGDLDAVASCVFKLDARGQVLFCNAAALAFCGLDAVPVGESFFGDLVPASRQPAFYGRFLQGVRSGRLAASFPFVFGADAPVEAEVDLVDAAEPGVFWVVLRDLAHRLPSRERQAALKREGAQAFVERRALAKPVDPAICEQEPIHTPGAIQAHAALLALDPDRLIVEAFSDGAPRTLGVGLADLLGAPLAAVLPADAVAALREALLDGRLLTPDRPWQLSLPLGAEARPHLLSAHLNDGRLLIELEMEPEHLSDYCSAKPLDARRAVARIRAARTLQSAASACADEVRAMTGFQRVLIYRFDADWNGEAVAESLVDGYESLLGLRFPASDIPAQARALYTRAPGRFVLDRDAPPSLLLTSPAADARPVNLAYAQSRALSPIHLEYQRNLGVDGSMSLSVLVGGKLWGLVIGHHHRPHYVAPDVRALAALVADGFALRLHELFSVQAWSEQQAALEVQNELLSRLARAEDFVSALTAGAGGSTLLDLVAASGAAVVSGERVERVGATPDDRTLLDLAAWLRASLPPEQPAFDTADLSEHWPGAQARRGLMSGLLAVFVGVERRHLLLWLRPDVPATVVWGGDPRKSVTAEDDGRTVLPRRSFERWVEERRGQADPWEAWQIGAASSLAAAIEGVVLRQGRRIAELSAKQEELTEALEQREILAREIDHRVKNSLQIVASIMQMQARTVEDPAAKAAFQDTFTRVMSVARVHDSLQHAQDAETVDLGETLKLLCGDIAAGLTENDDRLKAEAEAGLMVPSRTAVALSLVATELITNALKYAYAPGEPGPVTLRLGAQEGRVQLSVCDEGRGLPQDWDTRQRASGGLGMKVIRSMLKQIGAEMSVLATHAPGTCFVIAA